MKKIINNVENILDEMLNGIVKSNIKNLKRLDNTDVIVNSKAPIKNKVALVSGGGSGHEPAHAGFVGDGMLDAAVCGSVLLRQHQTRF